MEFDLGVGKFTEAPIQPIEPTNDKRGAKENELHLTPELVQPKRAAHYLWAVLIARIYEMFPLLCPKCAGQMRLIAFITHRADGEPDWDMAAQPAPGCEVDQRINW